MQGKIKKKGIYRVSVYFNEQELTSLAAEAEKAKFRRVGIPIRKQKEHGFGDEWQANTDGISRFLKYTLAYWRDHEKERLEQAAALAERERALQAEKKKLGL